ncbi:AMP-binding protein [Nocardioides sp. R-C-SC26]|uniref:AMP-binding protein n=1 Tax=Nocardioides sp. R-C-SC26 TaxID=2870414 RepID=UPI001E2A12EB|nr:AMP-binding protein [Nocardioides sp. R-C-SC26]
MSAPAGFWTRLRTQLWAISVLVRSRMFTLMRPDKYLGFVRTLRAQGTNATTSFSLAAIRSPHGIGIIDERGSLTWRELQVRADALAVALTDLVGSRPETVAILCRNHRGFVDALIANSRLGGQALLLNTGFSGPQLADVMEREGARVILYDEEFAGIVADARERIPGLVEVLGWVDDEVATHPHPTIEELLGRYAGRHQRPQFGSRVVLLTSGTTGTPKGAKRAGGGTDELAGMIERIPWLAEETVVVAAPMFHAWGFGQLVIGATMTCTVVMRRRFDPESTLALVDEHRATGLSVVPVMLERIVDLPDEVLDRYSLASLRFVSASGSRMRPDAVTAFMDRFGDVVHNSYNATEVGQISVALPADLRHAPDTAGRAVRGTLLRVVDDEGRDVATGAVGRIVVHGVSPFEGYTTGATKDFLGDYMVSGDVGRLDEAGRLYVVGRDDDMIVSGGENVYPIEVEKTLGAHPDVREVVVIGVDDEAFGQRLAAYVVPVPGTSPDVDALRGHVKATLAGYKVPRDVVLLDELPRNASGKVMVRELPPSSGTGTSGAGA